MIGTDVLLGYALIAVGIMDFVLPRMLGDKLPENMRKIMPILGVLFILAGLFIVNGGYAFS